MIPNLLRAIFISGICLMPGTAATAQIYSEKFESFTAPTGNFNAAPSGQVGTGLDLAHSGNLTGWNKSGGGAVHIVDHANLWRAAGPAGPRNFAVMIWQDNVITQQAAIPGSNQAGTTYAVDFIAAPAVYEAPSQATAASDGIKIEVLRATDNAVIHAFTHQPGAFAGVAGDLRLAPGSFTYTGNGSGDIKFRLGPSAPGSGRFGGAMDDLTLTVQTPVFDGYSANPALYVAGHAIAANLPLGINGQASRFSIAPPLPAGLVFNTQTGSISGTPSAVSPATQYTITASFPAAPDQAVTLVLSVLAHSTLTGYAVSPADYFFGVTIAANQPKVIGAAPAGFSISPALPAGLVLNPAIGAITGTPVATTPAADYTITASFPGEPDSTSILRLGVIVSPSTVMITEFMASNETTHYDGDGNASDWIELHNFGAAPLNLSGWCLTDRADNLTKWRFPGVTLPAGGYLVVYASNQSRDDYIDAGGRLHTNFLLSASGEYLGLIKPNGVTVEHAFAPAFPPQVRGISYGIAANQAIAGFFNTPTPGAANPASPSAAGPLISGVTDSPLPLPGDGNDIVIRARVTPFVSPVASVTLRYRVMFGAEQTAPMTAGAGGEYTATIPHTASAPGQMVRWYVTAQDSLSQSRREPPYLDPANSPQYFGTVIANPATASPLPALHWFLATPSAAGTLTGTRCAIWFDGEFYDNVFVRVRGASSVNWAKKAHKLEFNTGHHFRYANGAPRVEEINLNTTQQDKSYVRESLTYETYRAVGVSASDALLVHVEQNGQFFSVAPLVQQVDEDFFTARGMDPEGALYKMNNGITSTANTEKRTRLHEGTADLQALIAGLAIANPNRNVWIFDNVDLPSAINYFTCAIVTQDFDRFAKNYYIYRDTNGSREWTQLPWDKDLTLGERFVSDDISGDGFLDETPDAPENNAHPFWCATGHARHGVNNMVDAVIAHPVAREMYLRRLRTLMDELLQPPGTPTAQLKFEARLDQLFPLLQIDAAKDLAKWGSAVIPEQPARQTLATAMNLIKTNYLAERRVFLYQRHGMGVIGDGIPSTLVSGTTGATIARYMVPGDNLLGLNWTAKNFDDAAWSSGATGLGFETIPSTHSPLIATRVRPSETHAASTSIFLRIRFNIADLSKIDALELRMKYDDGFVAWLNGTEIARRNIGGAAGSLVAFNAAATSRPDAQAIVFQNIDVNAFSSALVQGENVLAIHALNSSATNSDMLILSELAELPKPASLGSVGIPGAQPPALPLAIGTVEFNPASGNQNHEFVQILNPNPIAVDVSGWTVEGAIEHTFKPGTVIPSNTRNVPLYLSPHVNSFRARPSAPTGNSGVFVQGNYRGQLSARGETITIRDRTGNIAATTTWSGAPSDAQRFLRITEIHYHPAGASAAEIGAGFTDSNDFEFIEIRNIGPAPINIGGVHYDEGVEFVIPAGTVLAAGELAVIVSSTNAFAARYGAGPRVLGQYTGRLDNDGEALQLQDAAGENILKFTFNDRWYPATDGGGYAMVILGGTADWSRWDFAAGWGIGEPLHGSPGTLNSSVIRQQFAGWLNHHFSEAEILDPLVSGPAADPNGDGLTNFHHYAFGSNPRAAGVPTDQPLSAIRGNFLEFTHQQRAAALDLEYLTETSDNLNAWTIIEAPVIQTSTADINSMVTVTRRDPRIIDTPGDTRRFLRVRAVLGQ